MIRESDATREERRSLREFWRTETFAGRGWAMRYEERRVFEGDF